MDTLTLREIEAVLAAAEYAEALESGMKKLADAGIKLDKKVICKLRRREQELATYY